MLQPFRGAEKKNPSIQVICLLLTANLVGYETIISQLKISLKTNRLDYFYQTYVRTTRSNRGTLFSGYNLLPFHCPIHNYITNRKTAHYTYSIFNSIFNSSYLHFTSNLYVELYITNFRVHRTLPKETFIVNNFHYLSCLI